MLITLAIGLPDCLANLLESNLRFNKERKDIISITDILYIILLMLCFIASFYYTIFIYNIPYLTTLINQLFKFPLNIICQPVILAIAAYNYITLFITIVKAIWYRLIKSKMQKA